MNLRERVKTMLLYTLKLKIKKEFELHELLILEKKIMDDVEEIKNGFQVKMVKN